jgi:LysM repeat protein
MKIYQASDGTEISQSELIKDIEEPNETTYSVRDGETCNTIAEKIGTTVNLILQSNPQLNNDCTNLKEGDILAIPAPQQSEPTVTVRDENIEHLVQKGETCGQIAKMYTVTLTELLTTNGLTEEDCQKMQIGVVLSIP